MISIVNNVSPICITVGLVKQLLTSLQSRQGEPQRFKMPYQETVEQMHQQTDCEFGQPKKWGSHRLCKRFTCRDTACFEAGCKNMIIIKPMQKCGTKVAAKGATDAEIDHFQIHQTEHGHALKKPPAESATAVPATAGWRSAPANTGHKAGDILPAVWTNVEALWTQGSGKEGVFQKLKTMYCAKPYVKLPTSQQIENR